MKKNKNAVGQGDLKSPLLFYFLLFFQIIFSLSICLFSVAKHPAWGLLLFVLGHIQLYLLIKTSAKQRVRFFVAIVLVAAFLLRLAFLSYPVSDDMNRYIWEGKKVWAGYNPYIENPLQYTENEFVGLSVSDKKQIDATLVDLFGLPDNWQAKDLNQILKEKDLVKKIANEKVQGFSDNFKVALDKYHQADSKGSLSSVDVQVFNRKLLSEKCNFFQDKYRIAINHPEMPTVYPPVGEYFFAMLSKISPTILSFKVFFLIVDMGNLVLICFLLAGWGLARQGAMFYAFSPLVLLYGVGECHLDVLHLFFILASLCLLTLVKESKYILWGYFLLGLAVMTKYLSVIILLFFVKKETLKYLPVFFLPFLLWLPFVDKQMFDSLHEFSVGMHYNDFFPRIWRFLSFGNVPFYKVLMFFSTFIFLSFFWFFYQMSLLRGLYYSWLFLLLNLPVLHGWYLLPLVAFACFGLPLSAFVFSACMGFQFFVLHHQLMQQTWIEFDWVWMLTYGFLILSMFLDKFYLKPIGLVPFKKVSSVDVIVPTFNEEMNIKDTLENLFSAIKEVPEREFKVYVVDGGSSDKTVAIAKDFSVEMIYASSLGRGNQLREGFVQSKGELVLFLHADSKIRKHAFVSWLRKLDQNQFCAWGVLGHKYNSKLLRLRVIECLNYIRVTFLGIGFGDQGMFFRREVLEKIEVPAYPLMEDLEISLRLGAYSNRLVLNGSLDGSARRWKKKPFFKSVSNVIYLCCKFLIIRNLGFDTKRLSEKMYKKYYE